MSAIDVAVISEIQDKVKNLTPPENLCTEFDTLLKEHGIRRSKLFGELDQETKSAVAEAYTLYGRNKSRFKSLERKGVDFCQLESTFGLDFLFSVDGVRSLDKLVNGKEDFMPVVEIARSNKERDRSEQWRPRHLKFGLDSSQVCCRAAQLFAFS